MYTHSCLAHKDRVHECCSNKSHFLVSKLSTGYWLSTRQTLPILVKIWQVKYHFFAKTKLFVDYGKYDKYGKYGKYGECQEISFKIIL